jgi:HKD family nuclease
MTTYLFFYYDGKEKVYEVQAKSMWEGNYIFQKRTGCKAWKVRVCGSMSQAVTAQTM